MYWPGAGAIPVIVAWKPVGMLSLSSVVCSVAHASSPPQALKSCAWVSVPPTGTRYTLKPAYVVALVTGSV